MTGCFTNNWKGLKNAMLFGGWSHDGSATVYNRNGACLAASADDHVVKGPLCDLNRSVSPSSTGQNSVILGTSDTAPTAADFDLGSPWSSGVSYVSVSNGERVFTADSCARTFSVTVTNTSDSPVTVREFGIFSYAKYNSGSTSSTSPANQYMLYRGVLDEPVTLQQYDNATLTFTITVTLGEPI